MKRLQKLIRLNEYLVRFSLTDFPEITPKRVVDQENSTSVLAKAAGDQILIALPEVSESGENTDSFTDSLSLAFFVLAKINGPARTQASADEAYARLLELCQAVLVRLSEDLTSAANPCALIGGLRLTNATVVPQYSVFGGWSGYSIEITLE